MGGGAAVLGAMSALPSLKPAVNVKAWVPMTDNMLGGDAMRGGVELCASASSVTFGDAAL